MGFRMRLSAAAFRSSFRLRLLLSFCVFPPMLACRTVAREEAELQSQTDATDGGKAKVFRNHKLPMEELSGLDLLKFDAEGRPEFLGVGDHDFVVSRFKLKDGFTSMENTLVDLRTLFNQATSQWEGVATDGAGRVFLLEESPSFLYVVDENLSGVLAKIKLELAGVPGIQGDANNNSLGEGLTLLRNGHIIVLKEKDPPALIEFGPKNDQPIGVSAETLLSRDQPMPVLAGTSSFHALKIWTFTDKARNLMTDFSEIAVGPESNIYLLSDESKRIGRLESKLRVTEDKVAIKRYWDLPSSIESPEGLSFVGQTALVGSDKKGGGPNVFVLEPLP